MEVPKDVKMDAGPTDETPSRSKDLSKTLPEEAFNNFVQGKRHMVVKDYSHAVQSLAKACEMYTEHFGELALECGEVYFLYGKALFLLSQKQAGVFGNALNEESTEDDDEDQEEKSSEEESKENESEKNDSDTGNGDENEEVTADGSDASNVPSESTDSPKTVVEEAAKDSNEKAEQSNAEEASTETAPEENQQESEEDDLELAWNSLETARTIFQRQSKDNVEAQLKIADILQLLAEISMESDSSANAIKDLEACLVIKERYLKDDDRLLAESYYQMALAQTTCKLYKEAIGNFMTTIDILKKRKNNLLNMPRSSDSFENIEMMKEVTELDSIMDDIQEKIEDTRALILETNKEIHEALLKREKEAEQVGFSEEEKKPESGSKPISNITHLLKRKKPEPDDAKEPEPKRVKCSPSVQNGDTTIPE